jgi:2-oxo-4-hydroxy-4-carboxy--5-ureidoimidazoline (OHCU) decarboxylase
MRAINELDQAAFVERFGSLFEHSPWVAEAAFRDRPIANREEL